MSILLPEKGRNGPTKRFTAGHLQVRQVVKTKRTVKEAASKSKTQSRGEGKYRLLLFYLPVGCFPETMIALMQEPASILCDTVHTTDELGPMINSVPIAPWPWVFTGIAKLQVRVHIEEASRGNSLPVPIVRSSIMKQLKNIYFIMATLLVISMLGCASTSKTATGTEQYIDDSVITTKVKAAIFNEPTLNSAEINVETYKGTVQLSGFVSGQADKSRAAEIAKNVEGVKSVKNSMQVK